MKLKPMLAKEADPASVDALIESHEWVMSEKVDGQRLVISIKDGEVSGYSRSMKDYDLPQPVVDYFSHHGFQREWLIDAEYLNDTCYLFDLMHVNNFDITSHTFEKRHASLSAVVRKLPTSPAIKLLPTYLLAMDKKKVIKRLRTDNHEGVVFRSLAATYEAGQRSAGLLKYKFRSDADCVVMATGVDGKDNLSLGMYDDDDRLVEVCKCSSLTGDGPSVIIGDVVTVNFLSVSKDLRLIQPVTPRKRTDKFLWECTLDQIKHKVTHKKVLL